MLGGGPLRAATCEATKQELANAGWLPGANRRRTPCRSADLLRDPRLQLRCDGRFPERTVFEHSFRSEETQPRLALRSNVELSRTQRRGAASGRHKMAAGHCRPGVVPRRCVSAAAQC